MESNPVLQAWERFFPETPPAGFLLRKNHPEQWLRFHTLPDGGRVPKGELGIEGALQRMRRISGEVFQLLSPITLFITSFSGPNPPYPEAQWNDFKALLETPLPWANALQDYVDIRHMKIWVRTGAWDWENVAFFFREAAMDRIGHVTTFSPLTGVAICPYDGGVDTFLPDTHQRAELKGKFKAWLPSR